MITEAKLTERHARALLKLPTEARAPRLQQVIDRGLTVSKTEEAVEEALRLATLPQEAKGVDLPSKTPVLPQNTPFLPHFSPQEPFRAVSDPQADRPVQARKRVAIQSLEPLYVSLDRPLAILRRAGCETEMQHHEQDGEVTVTIRIRHTAG